MRILITTILIVLADQISKFFIKGFSIPILGIHSNGLGYGDKHEIFGSLVRITFVENPGMAFGIDIGISSKLFLSIFSIAASIGILIYLYQNRNERFMLRFSLALILGGAIGNLIDRVFYGVIYGYAQLFQGKVVDFVDVDFFDLNLFGYIYDRWPIFNVADMAVSVGVILLILFSRKLAEKNEAALAGIGTNSNLQLEGEMNSSLNQNISEASTQNSPDNKEVNNDQPALNNDKPDNNKEIPI
ncbi:MAG: signal peptidase II [Ignavibacteriales bacterium]|nr:signal peptidase II [Ignavibacteriales bacterium]